MRGDLDQLLVPPKRSDRLGTRIADDIKRLIFSRKLQPGDKLPPERELSSVLRVSRVVVREALRILEQAGLVETTGSPRTGTVVAQNLHKPVAVSMAGLYHQGQLTLDHFVEMREATECFLIRLAATRAEAPQLDGLSALNDRLLEDVEGRTVFREHHRAFHLALAELSGNPLGVLLVRSLFEILETVRPSGALQRAFVEHTHARHRAILSALEARDPDRCAQAMAADVAHTRQLPTARRTE
ncbi:MAG: FadR family transcriptional regulator [Deltaproteobacteria bacterium]|nr:FadR family transcriptional regulator [Deltaproteobacteria bacterium]